jgi:integrase
MKAKWSMFQSFLGESIASYLKYKRALNRSFRNEEMALRLLDRYLIECDVQTISQITDSLLQEFLASRPRSRPRSYNHLRGVVHQFFSWMHAHDRISNVLTFSRVRPNTSPRRPYIFDRVQAGRLLVLASELQPASGATNRGLTYHLIFGMLYALGLRVSEVCGLLRSDIDWQRELLIVRDAKFDKSRLIPFGPRIAERMRNYLHVVEAPDDWPLFWFDRRPYRAINPCTISQTFHGLVPKLKLTIEPGQTEPRLHDLRHSFAVGALLRCYREGKNPADILLPLSTFLGHSDPASTAVYLTITTELLAEANDRFERFVSPLILNLEAKSNE